MRFLCDLRVLRDLCVKNGDEPGWVAMPDAVRAKHSPGRRGERRQSQQLRNSGTRLGYDLETHWPPEAVIQSTYPGSLGTESRHAGGNQSPVRAAGTHRAAEGGASMPLLRR